MNGIVVVWNRKAFIVSNAELRRCLMVLGSGHDVMHIMGMDLGTTYDLDQMQDTEARELIQSPLFGDGKEEP